MNHALPYRVSIERDADGLQLAVRTLFEESLRRHRLDELTDRISAKEAERIRADEPLREISPGYYTRAGYLLELANTLELGISFPPDCFTQADIAGMVAVKRARLEFEREHPPCPRCGERQDNPHQTKCHACSQKLRGGRS